MQFCRTVTVLTHRLAVFGKMADMDSPHDFSFLINEDNLEETGLRALKVIKPTWDANKIKSKILTGGITNKLICFFEEGKFKEDAVVMRVYGQKTDLIIDRNAEKKNMTILSKQGICPPLYATFHNGIMYGFAQGVTLDENTVRDDTISRLVAREIVRLQQVVKPGDQGKQLHSEWFAKLQNWLEVLPEEFEDPARQKKFKEMIKPKSVIAEETKMLHERLENMKCPIVFAHNDLLLGNVVYTESEKKVTFIDHEYGMYNYQPYDIGNHFCEFAGVDEVDYDRYPDKQFQMSWLKVYLEAWNQQQGKDSSSVNQEDLDKLYAQVNLCALAAHHFWGIWALIQAKYSAIDFDYLEYAVIRFGEYWRRREQFLSLSQ